MYSSSRSCCTRITYVEPVIFFIMFASALSESLVTDAIVFKMCKDIMGKESNSCSVLHENSSSDAAKRLQEKIQPYTAIIFMLKSSLEMLFPTVMCLFLGPWSDTNGRKPLFTFPFIGSTLYHVFNALISRFNLNAHLYLAPSIILSLTGGTSSISLACFCYITDVTDRKSRAWRLGFFDFAIFVGQLTGLFISPVLFTHFGYCIVFSTSAVICLLGLLYTFVLKEPVHNDDKKNLFKSMFDAKLIKTLLKILTKKRHGFDRCIIWCCLSIITLHDVIGQGTNAVLYLFTKKFGWNVYDFSTYSAIHLSVTMAGMTLLIKVISPYLVLPETVTIMIASLSNCGCELTRALAQYPWHVYLSTAMGVFSSAPGALIRSIISQIVPHRDIGKAFAVAETLEVLGPLAISPIFILLHTNYIKTYPSPVWFFPGGLSLLMIVFAIIVEHRWRVLSNKPAHSPRP